MQRGRADGTARDEAIVAGLLGAYRAGVFPMADPRTGRIDWLSPDPRAIVPLQSDRQSPENGAHFSRSLRQRVRSGRFLVTTDLAFGDVISACAARRPGAGGSWIDDRLIHAYTLLHRAGHAHSVEAWRARTDVVNERGSGVLGARTRGQTIIRLIDGKEYVLVGGLYGVHIGAAFFGESMFSWPARGGTDASKVCLVHLWLHLRGRGFMLLDSQFANEHMERFGIAEIPRADYLRRLEIAAARDVAWRPWAPEWRTA